jgi:hypothetical protein
VDTAATIYTCIREAPGSNLKVDINYPETFVAFLGCSNNIQQATTTSYYISPSPNRQPFAIPAVRICLEGTGGCIQKFPDWIHNEINNIKHSLRSNTKGYGGKTH